MTQAEQLLRELGIREPADIDVELIAAYCDAFVRRQRLDGCEANLVGNGSEAFITVNSRSRVERQRFSIGHELGHWLNDRGKILQSCSKQDMSMSRAPSKRERLANEFAADLLLPRFLFLPRTRGRPLDLGTVNDLAVEFTTSLTATALRIGDLDDRPTFVVLSRGTEFIWAKPSKEVPQRLWLKRVLDDRSSPARLVRKSLAETQPHCAQADVWVDHPDAADFEVVEQSIAINDGHVLTLLWWEDEAQIEALLDEE